MDELGPCIILHSELAMSKTHWRLWNHTQKKRLVEIAETTDFFIHSSSASFQLEHFHILPSVLRIYYGHTRGGCGKTIQDGVGEFYFVYIFKQILI